MTEWLILARRSCPKKNFSDARKWGDRCADTVQGDGSIGGETRRQEFDHVEN
jgi:hypothetical protein